MPERLKEGRYLRLKGCVIDAEERGDHNALGLRFIRWLEGKIYTICYFWYATRGGCIVGSYNNILIIGLVDR